MDSDIHSDSSSSLDDSGDSADENDLGEACSFKRRVLQLPECFCAEEDVFKEVLNPATWKSVLNSKHGEKLKSLLPVFPDDDEKEKSDTLRKLVEGENFKFGSPFKHFFHKLKDGFLSSDVIKVTNALKRANYREYRNQQQQYSYHLFQDILVSRKKLIDASYTLPPDQAVKMQQFTAKPKDATLSERTRLRYFSALQDLRDETGELETSSEDENYPESSPPKVPRKYKKQMQLHEAALSFEMTRITPTTSFPHGYPGSGHFLNHNIDMFEVSEERYREMLLTHKERMFLDPNHPELVISHIKLKDVTIRSNMTKRPSNKMSENPLKKKLKVSENSDKSVNSAYIHDYEGDSSASFATIFNREDSSFSTSGHDTNFDVMPPSVQETEVQTDPLTILDEGEDSQMFDTAHQTANRLPSPHPEIHQYPTCFFALLRDIFCESVEQKLSAIKLEEKVRNWQGGPTAALFEWLNFQESWSDLVSSALKFLAGDLISILPDTFVPFLDYKEKQQQWQWIGSGRDSDEQMYGLCQQWLESKDDISWDILETSQGSPPPPRVTTGWIVRPTAEEEKQVYREQECIRYQNPHKAFTFKVHGYEAVVGPVKGVYGKESGINKAREHSLLTSDRPPFVTILSLVRDSAARLPNGEGTRADICELLKDSQYLAPASDQQIHTVVSGALDRLHYEKDPCVKYDVNRKLWIYLHRHRTEEEFERIHQAQAAAAKARKAVQKSKLPKFKSKEITRALTSAHATSSADNAALLNVDIPPVITSGTSVQSPRGGSSPRTQGSPKAGHTSNRYIMHAVNNTPPQAEVKCTMLGIDNQSKNPEFVQNDLQTSSVTSTVDTMQQTLSSTAPTNVPDISSSRQSSLGSALSLSNTKNVVGSLSASQIVSVTPVHIKSEQVRAVGNLSSHVHDVLNVDLKPSSPSFVGQPPVLQPILSHQSIETANSLSTITTSISPALISSNSVTKAKVNCASLSGLQSSAITGFQTIVIKQEPGIRSCNGVSTIPLLSIEERLPSTNPSAINSGPVVARLVHGSQYLSFSNIVASSTTCSTSKPITGAVQNFRVQGGNICQQVLSTSTIKVMHTTPVSTITDSRLPVIALKNPLGAAKDISVISQPSNSLSVCGRLYQMANVKNAVISSDTSETKLSEITSTQEGYETHDKDTKDLTIPALAISTTHSASLPVSLRNTQAVIKVSPK
ncbi:nuclear factor related to kappa-B-binding protein-like [Stegodyphus dumicola]|uniref:nuclear factor related to kappa-B-binding protein-like n=1 Tax=Stegodyphus dumicola TaxID=202533 RepID=UPI0015B34BFC|nr:nuclear factor related to kappa-B-binding protein-like [Stegodyphus dumicola]XP_035218986.1 nuclear factor related to kappa-B-binding protein-like [Stegodyphus dumicola]XP_035218987.1 nuclear factor related to kappa-B-binding protein-like [Stegodyphus dumicola]